PFTAAHDRFTVLKIKIAPFNLRRFAFTNARCGESLNEISTITRAAAAGVGYSVHKREKLRLRGQFELTLTNRNSREFIGRIQKNRALLYPQREHLTQSSNCVIESLRRCLANEPASPRFTIALRDSAQFASPQSRPASFDRGEYLLPIVL